MLVNVTAIRVSGKYVQRSSSSIIVKCDPGRTTNCPSEAHWMLEKRRYMNYMMEVADVINSAAFTRTSPALVSMRACRW